MFAAACGGEPADPSPTDAGFVDASNPDAAPIDSGPLPEIAYLTRLESAADLARLTAANEETVKYLFPIDGKPGAGPLTEACYFQNMRRYPWHLQFLQSFPELRNITFDAYLALVLRSQTRAFYGGAIRMWPGAPHPSGSLGVMTLTVYSEPGQLSVDDIAAAMATFKECSPFSASFAAFLPEDAGQKVFARNNHAALLDRGVYVVFPEELSAGIAFEAYSQGEGYGTLRIIPKGQLLENYSIRDVVIVESAPTDISIVAGLITADRQSLHSHANLRLIEKGIPNVSIPRIYDDATVRALDRLLVHLTVTDRAVKIEPARLEDAEAFWARTRPVVPQPTADLTVGDTKNFDALRAADAIAYGVKASNLGEIHRALPPQARPDGFGIPFALFRDFAVANNIDDAVEAMLNDPRMKSDAEYKGQKLNDLRDQIRAAAVPPAILNKVYGAIEATFGANAATTPIKLRSSTNVEDLANLSGAGLYESKRGCLADDRDGDALGPSSCLSAEERADLERRLDAYVAEQQQHPERLYLQKIINNLNGDLTEEKTVERALKRVWASLWTERAYDEREYYGIDHRLVYMGLAVNASYALEQANAVAVTNLSTATPGLSVRLVSQVGDEEVVAPEDPTGVPELITFTVTSTGGLRDVVKLVSSTRVPAGELVWPRPALESLASRMLLLQRHFEAEVYPDIRPLRLDLELKLSREGEAEVKQARPFVGSLF